MQVEADNPAVLTTLTFLYNFVEAVQLPKNTSHVAFAQDRGYGPITFAATLIRDVGDLYFHFETPAENSWGAIGIGSEMKNSLMWIFYRSKNNTGKSLTPKKASL